MPAIGSARARISAPRPRPSRMASAPGFSVSPHSFSRGNCARSISRTRTPARASTSAATLPDGPAPATITSGSVRIAPDRRRTTLTDHEPRRHRGTEGQRFHNQIDAVIGTGSPLLEPQEDLRYSAPPWFVVDERRALPRLARAADHERAVLRSESEAVA